MSMRALSRQRPIVGPVSRGKRLTLEPLPGFILLGMADTAKPPAIAVAAIHDFRRFQVNEHQTSDSLDVTSPR